MTDTLKPMSPQWIARQRRHRHNSYLGHIAMCKQNMRAIHESDTTTPKAKALASRIFALATQLDSVLRQHRVDPKASQ